MKRYLVYYNDIPVGGVTAYDYITAKKRALMLTPRDNKKHIRIRLATKGLLKELANQKDYDK